MIAGLFLYTNVILQAQLSRYSFSSSYCTSLICAFCTDMNLCLYSCKRPQNYWIRVLPEPRDFCGGTQLLDLSCYSIWYDVLMIQMSIYLELRGIIWVNHEKSYAGVCTPFLDVFIASPSGMAVFSVPVSFFYILQG